MMRIPRWEAALASSRVAKVFTVRAYLGLDCRAKPLDLTEIGEIKRQSFDCFQIHRVIQVGSVDPIMALKMSGQVPSRESANARDE